MHSLFNCLRVSLHSNKQFNVFKILNYLIMKMKKLPLFHFMFTSNTNFEYKQSIYFEVYLKMIHWCFVCLDKRPLTDITLDLVMALVLYWYDWIENTATNFMLFQIYKSDNTCLLYSNIWQHNIYTQLRFCWNLNNFQISFEKQCFFFF